MANKLSWDPPKWKSYSFDGVNFKVELETGEIFKGSKANGYISLKDHRNTCFKIFGVIFGNNDYLYKLEELSQILDLKLIQGHWPEYYDVQEFIRRYYERVAKIEGSFTKSIISIESEFEIIPKFTL